MSAVAHVQETQSFLHVRLLSRTFRIRAPERRTTWSGVSSIRFALRPVSWLGEPTDNIRCPRTRAPLRYVDNEFGGTRDEVQYNVLGAPQVARIAALKGVPVVRALDSKGDVLREYRGGYLPAPEGLAAESIAAAMEVIEAYLAERAAGRLV